MSSVALARAFNRTAQPADSLILYGDQSFGSSVIFYTGREALLVNGISSSLIWGSHYPDAPHIFLSDADLSIAGLNLNAPFSSSPPNSARSSNPSSPPAPPTPSPRSPAKSSSPTIARGAIRPPTR